MGNSARVRGDAPHAPRSRSRRRHTALARSRIAGLPLPFVTFAIAVAVSAVPIIATGASPLPAVGAAPANELADVETAPTNELGDVGAAPTNEQPDDGSLLRSDENPLSLSDAQRQRIDEIIALSNQFAVSLKVELDDARDDLKRRLDEPSPDFEAVMDDIERVGELETQLRKHQIATLMSLRAQLSNEQRTGLMRLFRMVSDRHGPGDTAAAPSAGPTAQRSEPPPAP